MQSTQITLRNLKPSPAFTRRIRDKCDKLERFHPNIQHCRVQVEKPEARATRGSAWVVTIRVAVPGRELVVNQAPHADVHIALREAFAAMRRRLKDAASVGRGETKVVTRASIGGAP